MASLIEICRIEDAVNFFRFQPEMPFSGKFGPNCQYCQFKGKLDMLTYFVFDRKRPFWANLFQNVNCQFKGKFGS